MSASSSTKSPASIASGGDDENNHRPQITFPLSRDGSPSLNHCYTPDLFPEPFLEAMIVLVSIDAARSNGRLSVASAMLNIFQVCSSWWAVSRSESLWRVITRSIWAPSCLLSHRTWRQEFIFRHRTATNFRTGTYLHMILSFDSTQVDEPTGFICRRLALSNTLLACGFANGSVRIFHLPTRSLVATFLPHHRRTRLGPFSGAVAGILLSETGLVFATVDGDVHTVAFNEGAEPRRVVTGDVFSNGALVDFSGNDGWWVGLYAGVPGRAIHVWDVETEREVYVGGRLTDHEAVVGWHQLNEATEVVGRVRMTGEGGAVGWTRGGSMAVRRGEEGRVNVGEVERRMVEERVDVGDGICVGLENRGVAVLRKVETMEEVCRFEVGRVGGREWVMGCMSGGRLVMYVDGVIKIWEAEGGRHGRLVCMMGEMEGEAMAVVADERHVVACNSDSSIHFWDFGAQ